MKKRIRRELTAIALTVVAWPVAAEALDSIPVVPDSDVTGEPAPSDASLSRSEERAGSSSRLIEEIVVTAQKREENLQDVPISISAFSSDTLDAKGIVDLKDLARATPGLSITSTAGYTVTYLRGVGSDAFLLADPSVALYVDNVYYPLGQGQAQNLGLVERVEVLKGPQGTLFGRNAVGGAINVVLKKPDFQQTEVSLQSTFGRFDTAQERAYVSVPLSDTLAFSVGGTYDSAENYIDGEIGTPRRPLPRETAKGARAAVRWAPAEVVELNLSALRTQSSGVSTLFAVNTDPAPLFSAVIQPQDPYHGAVDSVPRSDVKNTVYSGNLQFNLDPFDIKLLGSDQNAAANVATEFDGSQVPLVYFEASPIFSDVQTAEVQLISNSTSWGSDWLNYVAGSYYFKGRQGFDPVYLTVAGLDLGAGTVLGVPIPAGLYDPLQQVLGGLPGIPNGNVELVGLTNVESLAYYLQATAALTDRFSVTLGGRYQDEKRTLVESTAALSNLDGSQTRIQSYGSDAQSAPIGGDVPGGNSRSTKGFKPKVTLDYHLGDDSLLYASWQQAVKSAAVNVINIYTVPSFIKPEEISAYEVGVKSKLFDGLMTVSSAIFQYDIDNLQVQFVSLLNGGAVSFENAKAARIRGIDFDTTTQLLPNLTDGLVMTLGGAFLQAEYTDYQNAAGFNSQTRLFSRNNDYTGNQIARTPRFSGTVGLSQTFSIPTGSLEIGGDYYYNSGFHYLAQEDSFTKEGAYGLLGLRASYLHERSNVRVTVFGTNLTNTRYNYSRFTLDFGTTDAAAPPAFYGIRLNWDLK
ncbi:TonB-dependent receptor [Hydrocarboniphaga sp.]|uniref:TonB-dependent receptor n=1 Tax=Hydrocarboniphaga sp. TaxID=2033016 RepID=UPI003D11E290